MHSAVLIPSSQACLKSAETTHVQAQHVSLLRCKLSTACCTRMRGPSSEVRQDGGAAAHTSMLGHTSQCMLRRCQGAERASHLRLLRLLQAGCQRVHGGPEAAQVTLHLHCQGRLGEVQGHLASPRPRAHPVFSSSRELPLPARTSWLFFPFACKTRTRGSIRAALWMLSCRCVKRVRPAAAASQTHALVLQHRITTHAMYVYITCSRLVCTLNMNASSSLFLHPSHQPQVPTGNSAFAIGIRAARAAGNTVLCRSF